MWRRRSEQFAALNNHNRRRRHSPAGYFPEGELLAPTQRHQPSQARQSKLAKHPDTPARYMCRPGSQAHSYRKASHRHSFDTEQQIAQSTRW